MKDLGMKQNILKEIMDLMDTNEGDQLKKHPKFAKVSVLEVKKPESEEMPMMKEKVEGEEELDPEMIQALLEQLQKEKE